MSKQTTNSKNIASVLFTFALTFFSSLTVVGSGILLASIFTPNSFVKEYTFEDMDYTEEELAEINNQNILDPIVTIQATPFPTSILTSTPQPSAESNKKNDSEKYKILFQKLKKRADILQSKNEKLEVSKDIDNAVFCLNAITKEQFINFSEDPDEAFSNALGYCSFFDFSAQIQAKIDRNMKNKKKKEVEKKFHKFSGVIVSQNIINNVLNSANWNKATRTLLGNQQNINHDISYLNNPDLSILGIKELIGVGLSKYPHSSRSRKTNLRNAISKLDGRIIHPEETLSIVNSFAPFTYNNGYVDGIIIKDGKDVHAMGGGVCQSVTTMFRAWQNSGLEITKFQPHSKSISYYGGIGFDATIYKSAWKGGDVDLLLKNNSENSILIKVVDSDPYQMVYLYGTRDRKVLLNRYHFSKYKGNQVAKWKRSIEYKNSGEWVENFFQEWQKLY